MQYEVLTEMNSELRDKIFEIEKSYTLLNATRYIVTRADIIQWDDAKLRDVEKSLFNAVQEINMEKGRREHIPFK
jgi:hypothetical protein